MQLPDRARVEEIYTKRFQRLSARHQRELERLLGNPPDWRRVPESFWQKVKDEEAAALILLLADTHYRSGVLHGADERVARSAALSFAGTTGPRLAEDFVTHSKEMLRNKQQRWEEVLREKGRVPKAEVKIELKTLFGKDRNESMVETETTRASVAGGEAAIAANGVRTDEDVWKTNPHRSATGPCKICAPLHGTPRPIWSAQFPMGPPGPHPRCVCEILYRAMYTEQRWLDVLASL